MIAVYDRSDLPEAVLELIRRTDCGIGSDVLVVRPVADVKVADYHYGGCLRLMPGTETLLFGSGGRASQWSARTREPLCDVPLPNVYWQEFAVSPDGSVGFTGEWMDGRVVDPRSWAVVRELPRPFDEPDIRSRSDPQFTPDGKYLLLRVTTVTAQRAESKRYAEPTAAGLWVYDTASWQRVPVPPFLPPECVGYRPATEQPLAVIERAAGGVVLWDVDHRRAVVTLDADTRLSDAAFSPDGSAVAVDTAPAIYFDGSRRGPHRLRLFETKTGRLIAELLVADIDPVKSVGLHGALRWSPDGRLVLSAVSAGAMRGDEGMGVWDARTGRHRAQLTMGTNGGVLGSAVLPTSGQIVAGCGSGHILFWKLPVPAVRP